MYRTHQHAAFTLLLASVATSCVPDANRRERVDADFVRIVAAEDARPSEGAQLDFLVATANHHLAFLRHSAVRALGRLENPALLDEIAPVLDDPAPLVRRSAANAIAQAVHSSSNRDGRAADLLLARVDVETDPTVRGTLARSLGRLELSPSRRRDVMDVLVDMSRAGDDAAPDETLIGVALGLEAMIRRQPDEATPEPVVRRLQELARQPTIFVDDPLPARIRGLALNALGILRRLDGPLFLVALADEAPASGVTAARYLDQAPSLQRPEILRRIIGNRRLLTVIEGFLTLQRSPRTEEHCRYLFAGAMAPVPDGPRVMPAVAIPAFDALARPCPDLAQQRDLLLSGASRSAAGAPWQVPAHALVSLATLFPNDAAPLVPTFARSDNPFARAYAARAATLLGDRAVLRSLADDPVPNVRTAALQGLAELEGHGVDALALSQLQSANDPQLLMTAAGALRGTPEPNRAATVALDAFERISSAGRETWRDPRMALLELIAAEGASDLAPRLAAYLDDYDAVVAQRTAEILSTWGERTARAEPRPLPRADLPSVQELRSMDETVVRLHMAEGGTIDIDLDPYDATTNVYRFYRLVGEGYFDGLTFHRWAPNFVIQGGSPGANEYQGDAAYSRDEVGLLPHWRGTVGISTRGHDTGDGQIFVNLLHNVRLDHTYTLIGSVVDGMDVVDAVLEGAVIERAELVSDTSVAGM